MHLQNKDLRCYLVYHYLILLPINESTRVQLEAINTALAELQVEHCKHPKRKLIGFIQPKEEEENTND